MNIAKPNRKVDGAARYLASLGPDAYRLTLLPNDLPAPIVEAFTEEEKEAAYAICLPPR